MIYYKYYYATLLILVLSASLARTQSSLPLQLRDIITRLHNHRLVKQDDLNLNLLTKLPQRLLNHFETHAYTNVSTECQNKIDYLIQNLKNDSLWSWQS